MINSTSDVAVVRLGAARLAVRPSWANVAATGASHALGQSPVLAAGRPDERRAAFRSALAHRQGTQQGTQQTRTAALVAAGLLPTTMPVTRMPNFAHKTRINAGGYGAMGPHPEREQLA